MEELAGADELEGKTFSLALTKEQEPIYLNLSGRVAPGLRRDPFSADSCIMDVMLLGLV